uniref:Uncharacterized protein n=1 Tax=Magallana gigas TaxID=29159 RepID=K1R9H1_MAGGI
MFSLIECRPYLNSIDEPGDLFGNKVWLVTEVDSSFDNGKACLERNNNSAFYFELFFDSILDNSALRKNPHHQNHF